MISRALDRLLTEAWSSIRKFEAAEYAYRDVVAAHEARYGKGINAEYRAASDLRLRRAVGDCSYYQGRAQMYLTAALVQLGIEDNPAFDHGRTLSEVLRQEATA